MQGYNTWDQFLNPQHMTVVYKQGGLPSSQKKELHLFIFPLSNSNPPPNGSWWLIASYSPESQVALYKTDDPQAHHQSRMSGHRTYPSSGALLIALNSKNPPVVTCLKDGSITLYVHPGALPFHSSIQYVEMIMYDL